MTGQEIKLFIDANNEQIEKMLREGVFVLNTRIRELLEANEALRARCNHEVIENGACVFCGKVFEDASDPLQH